MSIAPTLRRLASTSRNAPLSSRAGPSTCAVSSRSFGFANDASASANQTLVLLQKHGSARLPTPFRPVAPSLPHLALSSTIKFATITPDRLGPLLDHYAYLCSASQRQLYTDQDQHAHRAIHRILRRGASYLPEPSSPYAPTPDPSPEDVIAMQSYFAAADSAVLGGKELNQVKREKARRDVESGVYQAEDEMAYEDWRKLRLESVERRRLGLAREEGLDEKQRRQKEFRLERGHQRKLREGKERREVIRERKEQEGSTQTVEEAESKGESS